MAVIQTSDVVLLMLFVAIEVLFVVVFVMFGVASYFFERPGVAMELRWYVECDGVRVLQWRVGGTYEWKTVETEHAYPGFVFQTQPAPCCSPAPVEGTAPDELSLLSNAYRQQILSLEAIISRFQLQEELRIKSEAEAGLAYRRLA